jgi:two-component system cell cycle sensor histidine kinase/response regulator CckA
MTDPGHDAASGPAVLLVEDEAPLRRLLSTTLRRAGYDVIEAAGGKEALELFAANTERILMLITDVKMPEVRGPALAARIREQAPALPVLFITGYAEREGISADDALLHKPFRPAVFVSTVKEILGRPPI